MRSFLYLHTANVAAARGFYSEMLGLDEIPAAGDTSPTWSSEPVWVGYWSFPVLDPMGNTVEVSAVSRQAWSVANG